MEKQFDKDDFSQVVSMTEAYFKALHHGDQAQLEKLFHRDVVLKAPGIRRTREEWLALVTHRPVPLREGHAYDYKIVSIDLVGDQAMVKALCPLLGHTYIDFLGFLKEDSNWYIVSKMYADF